MNDNPRDTPQSYVILKDEHGTITKIGVTVLNLDTYVLTLPNGIKCVASAKVKVRATRRDLFFSQIVQFKQTGGQFTAVIDGDTADFSAFYDDASVHVWRGADHWA